MTRRFITLKSVIDVHKWFAGKLKNRFGYLQRVSAGVMVGSAITSIFLVELMAGR